MTKDWMIATKLLAATCVVLASGFAFGGVQNAWADCVVDSETELETRQCVGDERRAADAELNEIHQRLQKLYADDPAFLDKLKLAQRAWIAFRDAALEARFPGPDKHLAHGSVYPMCAGLALTEMTRKRIEELKVWVDGTEEGDVCDGSVRWTSR